MPMPEKKVGEMIEHIGNPNISKEDKEKYSYRIFESAETESQEFEQEHITSMVKHIGDDKLPENAKLNLTTALLFLAKKRKLESGHVDSIIDHITNEDVPEDVRVELSCSLTSLPEDFEFTDEQKTKIEEFYKKADKLGDVWRELSNFMPRIRRGK